MTHASARNAFGTLTMLAIAGLAMGFGTLNARAIEPANPLSGPSVETKVAPGSNGVFGSGKEGGKARGEREIPHRDFMQAVQNALGEDAPEDVRASAELEQKIRAISSEFTSAQRTYAQENRATIAQLRELERPAKKDAKKPDAKGEESMQGEAPAMSDDDRAAMMEKLREVRDKAPKAADAHTKIWALLSEPQQAAVQVKLDEALKEMQERANEQYVKRRAGVKAGEGPNATPATATSGKPKTKSNDAAPAKTEQPVEREAAGKHAPMAPQQRERLMRLFERMTPEQREEVLRRIEERLGAGAAAGGQAPERTRRAARAGSEAKPAPGMESVNVPVPPAAEKDKAE